MLTIRTFVGRKLNHIDGIWRRQIELDRHLKPLSDIKLKYIYYNQPKNPIDFISKRYFLYPYRARRMKNKEVINHLTFQYLGDLAYFLNNENTIITCHDIYTFIEKSNLKNPFFIRNYSKAGLKKTKHIISISNFTKNELVSKLGIDESKIIVIKNGMNQNIFRPIKKTDLCKVKPIFPEYKKLLHVGTEVSRKDFITLLKAFYLIRKRRKDIKLIRVGKPSYSNLIKQLGLEKHIHYYSNISNERLNEFYNLCDLFVFPSIYEGWGAPGLEAASSGAPVICSDIPIFREVFQGFPVFFPPKNFKILAKKIIELLENDSQVKVMQQRGFKVVNQYSWKKSAMEYLKLMREIVE